MITASVQTGMHSMFGAAEQVGEWFAMLCLSCANADSDADAITPPAEVRGACEANQRKGMRGENLGIRFMGENEELAIAPSSDELIGMETEREHAFGYIEHSFTGLGPVGLADLLTLVEHDPEDAEIFFLFGEGFKG